MIEVEKKFQPTEEQLASLREDATAIINKTLHDIYYDFLDYKLFKNDERLRNRNGEFELKQRESPVVARETTNVEEIKKYFKTDDLEKFVKKNMIVAADYIQEAEIMQIGEFSIDMSKMSYGYEVGEVELLVDDKSKVKEAEEKIDKFGREYGLEFKKFPGKPKEYFRKVKPDVYNELYGGKE